jgi:hypothetical protein
VLPSGTGYAPFRRVEIGVGLGVARAESGDPDDVKAALTLADYPRATVHIKVRQVRS